MIQMIKLNMNICVMFLLFILNKTKMNLFYKYEHKNKIKSFSINKLKINLEPRI